MAENVGSIYSDAILRLDKYKAGLKEYVSISKDAANKTQATFSRDYTSKLAKDLDRLKNNSIGGLEDKLSKLQDRLKRTEIGSVHFKKVSKAIQQTQKQLDKANGSQASFNSKIAALGGIVSAGALLGLAANASKTAMEFEKYEAVLKNTLGTQTAATQSMKMIKEFAAATPFAVNELTGSFVKLANRGIVPTKQELTLLGDIAASQGKSFDQLTEAVLDAMTGEFERLKEFGIKASKNGDRVALSFKGITQNVKFTEQAIKDAVIGFGKLDGVAGGMAAISKTTGGAVSNLGDSVDSLNNSMGTLLNEMLAPIIRELSAFIGWLSKTIDEMSHTEKTMLKFGMALTGIVVTVGSLSSALTALGVTSTTVWTAMLGPIGLVATAIAGVTAAIVYLQAQEAQMEKEQQQENNFRIMSEIYQKKLDIAKIDTVLSQLSQQNIEDINKNQAAVNSYRQALISLGISKAQLATVFTESGGNVFVNEERLKSLKASVEELKKAGEKKAQKSPISFRTKVKPPKVKDLTDTKAIAQKWIDDHPLTLPFMVEEKQAPLELIERRVVEFQKKLDAKTKGKLDLLGQVKISSYEDFEKILMKISKEFGMTFEAAKKLFDLKPKNAQEVLEYEAAFKKIKGEISLTSDKIKEYESNIDKLQKKLDKQAELNERGVFSKMYKDVFDIAAQNPGGTTDTIIKELNKQKQALEEHKAELERINKENHSSEREAMLNEKQLQEEKLKNIREYRQRVAKERAIDDELTGGRSAFEKSIDEASDSIKTFQNLTKDTGKTFTQVFTDRKAGTAFINMIQSFADVGKQVFDSLAGLAEAFADNLNAKANLMKEKNQNMMNTINAFNHYQEKQLDEEIERTTNAFDKEIQEYQQKISDLKDADTSFYDDKISMAQQRLEELDELEAEYDRRREMRLLAFSEKAKEENEKQLKSALERLRLEYEAEIAKQEREQTDEATRLYNIETLRAEFMERQKQTKVEFDELLKQQVEEEEAIEEQKKTEELGDVEAQRQQQNQIIKTNEAQKEQFLNQKQAEREQKETQFNNKIKELEAQKAAYVENAEKRKEAAQKNTKIAEWAMGFKVFQVEKQAEMMQAQVDTAKGVMDAILGGIKFAGAFPPFSIPLGLAFGTAMTALALSTGQMRMQTVSAKQYPPLLLAEGQVGIGQGRDNADTIPAMLSNGESVINSEMTRQYRTELEQINAGTFQKEAMQKTVNNYYVMADGRTKQVSEREFDRLYQNVNSGFGRRI